MKVKGCQLTVYFFGQEIEVGRIECYVNLPVFGKVYCNFTLSSQFTWLQPTHDDQIRKEYSHIMCNESLLEEEKIAEAMWNAIKHNPINKDSDLSIPRNTEL